MSRDVRKPDYCICENKDADQLRGNREADQRLCFRYLDGTFPLLSKSAISSHQSSSVAAQPDLCRTWLETRRPVFSRRGSNSRGVIKSKAKGLIGCEVMATLFAILFTSIWHIYQPMKIPLYLNFKDDNRKHFRITLKLLNFGTLEILAVIYLKYKQRGKS